MPPLEILLLSLGVSFRLFNFRPPLFLKFPLQPQKPVRGRPSPFLFRHVARSQTRR
uniref:ADP-ribosylation factor 1-like isoform X1 n=1 Tax=Rhizophora mucronata TaxID=61149 RepID=A0A2P2NBH9_RHIMU